MEPFPFHLRGELRQGPLVLRVLVTAVFVGGCVVFGFPLGVILFGVGVASPVYGSYRRWRRKRRSY